MTTIPDSPSPHEDNAQAIRLDLQRLLQNIRGFTLLTTERRRRVSVTGHVDDDFLRSMALVLEAHPDVAAVSQITAAEIRDHLQFTGAHRGVGEELMLNGRKMIDTLIDARASVGERALRALNIVRSVNRPADRAALVAHLEAIDRDFSRGRRRRATARKPGDPATVKTSEVKP